MARRAVGLIRRAPRRGLLGCVRSRCATFLPNQLRDNHHANRGNRRSHSYSSLHGYLLHLQSSLAEARKQSLRRVGYTIRARSNSRSRNVRCPGSKRDLASSTVYQHPRSTSGTSICRPERGGHSIKQVLLRSLSGSQSPSNAQAVTIFPLGCFKSPSSMKRSPGTKPVSSSNSRLATSNGFSPSRNSPFGIDHAPKSFFAQNGPPGCTRNTSI